MWFHTPLRPGYTSNAPRVRGIQPHMSDTRCHMSDTMLHTKQTSCCCRQRPDFHSYGHRAPRTDNCGSARHSNKLQASQHNTLPHKLHYVQHTTAAHQHLAPQTALRSTHHCTTSTPCPTNCTTFNTPLQHINTLPHKLHYVQHTTAAHQHLAPQTALRSTHHCSTSTPCPTNCTTFNTPLQHINTLPHKLHYVQHTTAPHQHLAPQTALRSTHHCSTSTPCPTNCTTFNTPLHHHNTLPHNQHYVQHTTAPHQYLAPQTALRSTHHCTTSIPCPTNCTTFNTPLQHINTLPYKQLYVQHTTAAHQYLAPQTALRSTHHCSISIPCLINSSTFNTPLQHINTLPYKQLYVQHTTAAHQYLAL